MMPSCSSVARSWTVGLTPPESGHMWTQYAVIYWKVAAADPLDGRRLKDVLAETTGIVAGNVHIEVERWIHPPCSQLSLDQVRGDCPSLS